MLEHFTSNGLLSRHLDRKDVKDQFISILDFAHRQGLDWYFTDVPDLRCGRKEIDSTRASGVCFRFWFKNLNELLITSGERLGFQDTKIPLKSKDLTLLKNHIKQFAAENPAERPNGAFYPHHYKKLGPNANDPLNGAISRMVKTMLKTVDNSNGQTVLRIMKNKNSSFTKKEAENYLHELINGQDGLCAITGIRLQYPPDVSDPELVCSLDRIDSNADYQQGNLQIVCKFVNGWKSDTPDDEFRRLIELVKSQCY